MSCLIDHVEWKKEEVKDNDKNVLTFTRLDNGIGAKGAIALSEMLKANATVTSMNLRGEFKQ